VISSELILALDIGTSSTRTALFDQEGRCLRETRAQQTYLLRVDRSGMAELPVADLERAVLKTLRITLRARKKDPSLNPRPILAVGASCFWHSLLGYNARTHQTTPIYTWADARCRDDASRLRSRHDEKKYHALTGCMLRTPYWPSKLRWLHRIGAARDVTAWMSPAEWLYARLCGASSISISMASGTGLMNVRTCQWDSSLLRLARVKENHLGTISNEPLQPVREHPAIPSLHRFPELSHARWFPALGDGAASNLGSDATTGSTVAMNVGTSAALRWACRKPPHRRAALPARRRHQQCRKPPSLGLGATSPSRRSRHP
jgi:gluconokinase